MRQNRETYLEPHNQSYMHGDTTLSLLCTSRALQQHRVYTLPFDSLHMFHASCSNQGRSEGANCDLRKGRPLSNHQQSSAPAGITPEYTESVQSQPSRVRVSQQ